MIPILGLAFAGAVAGVGMEIGRRFTVNVIVPWAKDVSVSLKEFAKECEELRKEEADPVDLSKFGVKKG